MISIFATGALLFTTASGVPPTLAVLDPQVVGVSEDSARALAELVRDDFRGLGFRVASPQAMPDEPCADEVCASRIGRELGADGSLFWRLASLDNRIVISMNMTDVASGRVITNRSARASSFSEAVDATRGLIRGWRMSPASDPILLGSMAMGFRLSGLVGMRGYVENDYLYGASVVGSYETTRYVVEVNAGSRRNTLQEPKEWLTESEFDLGLLRSIPVGAHAVQFGGGVGIHQIRRNVRQDGIDQENDTGLATWMGTTVVFYNRATARVALDVRAHGTWVRSDETFPSAGLLFGLRLMLGEGRL